MKLKKIALGFLLLALLACSTVTNLVAPPTATPLPTATVTLTASPTTTATATAVPLVPAYIPPECANTALATLPAEPVITPTEEEQTGDELSKDEQLDVLKQVDHIVREVYVYPDYNGKNWGDIVSRYKSQVEAGLGTAEFYSLMQSMIAELGDDHSVFLPPRDVEAANEELEGQNQFVGIGIDSFAKPEQGRLVVVATFPDSPAEHAGIKAHDSILRVDGYPLTAENLSRIRGPACSALVVTVQSPGEAPRDLLLVRQVVKGNLQVDARLVPARDGSRIGYLMIPTFFDETMPAQVEKALEDFGQLDGLILDLRMNSGGSSIVAEPILSFFTTGRLGQFVGRNDSKPLVVRGDPIHNSQTVPMVVMVSEGTASYAEIFAGIMRDSRGAKITGQTSLGNVEALIVHDLQDGSQLWIATEAFYPAHSDENWEQTGIVPDVQAFADWGSFTFDNDPSIAAALTLLGH